MGGREGPGVCARLVDAVLDLPELHNGARLEAAAAAMVRPGRQPAAGVEATDSGAGAVRELEAGADQGPLVEPGRAVWLG
jgi:hypothetical protein